MCDVTPAAEVDLPSDLSAARRVRGFLRHSLCSVHQEPVTEQALLLLSELAVNAVQHGAPPVRALVDCRGDRLRLAVSDGSTTPPVQRQSSMNDESGRGVALVDSLSDSWGVQVRSRGKTVWCELVH